MSTIIGPMCGAVKLPPNKLEYTCEDNLKFVFDPGSVPEEKKQVIQSWSKDFAFYTTIGSHYCSCKAFKYGNGKLCKHLVAKSCRPHVHVRRDMFVICERSRKTTVGLQHIAGVYNFIGTFNFPVWVLDNTESSVYLFKDANYDRWMLSEYYESVLTGNGIIRSKDQYPNSILPPFDFWNQIWEVWSVDRQRWISTDFDFGITRS